MSFPDDALGFAPIPTSPVSFTMKSVVFICKLSPVPVFVICTASGLFVVSFCVIDKVWLSVSAIVIDCPQSNASCKVISLVKAIVPSASGAVSVLVVPVVMPDASNAISFVLSPSSNSLNVVSTNSVETIAPLPQLLTQGGVPNILNESTSVNVPPHAVVYFNTTLLIINATLLISSGTE